MQVTGSTTSFEAKLTGTDKTVKLLIAGNYGDAFANYAPAAGSDEATVRSGLGCSFAGLTGNLPMYGEVTLPNGLVPGVETVSISVCCGLLPVWMWRRNWMLIPVLSG